MGDRPPGPGHAPPWERPQGRGPPRWVWLAAAAAATAVAGVAIGGVIDDDEDLAVEEVDADADVAPAPSPLADLADARWETHHDLDSARAVEVDGDGHVWVATAGAGLVRFDGGDVDGDGSETGYTHHDLDLDGSAADISSVAADADGTIWAALGAPPRPDTAAGVIELGDDGLTAHPDAGGLDGPVSSVAVDDDGRVWAATAVGLATYDGESWTARTGDDEPGHSRVTEVQVDGDGAVWALIADSAGVSGAPAGVARFADGSWTTWALGEDLPHDRVVALAAGADGSVWLAARREPDPLEPFPRPPGELEVELLRFDDGDWVVEVVHDELPADSVGALAVDADGTVWIAPIRRGPGGAHDGALFAFDGQGWTGYGRDDGLPHPTVTGVTAHPGAGVWVATPEGVARYRDGRWVAAATGQGPAGQHLDAVVVDDDGAVWTAGHVGVARYDGDAWRSWTGGDGLAGEVITSVIVADDGAVWAGTTEGVSRFDGQGWTSWTADDGLGYPRVVSLAAGHDGAVWAAVHQAAGPPEGGLDSGLARFDGQSWTSWPAEEVPGEGVLTAVDVDAHGAVWIATGFPSSVGAHPPAGTVGPEGPPGRDHVVVRLHGGEWTSFGPDEGLRHGEVNAIAAGDEHVWVGTTRGVARFDGHRWIDRTDRDQLGLDLTDVVGRERIEAVTVDARGAVWAGGPWGVARFDGREWVAAEDQRLAATAIAVDGDRVWIASHRGLRELTASG